MKKLPAKPANGGELWGPALFLALISLLTSGEVVLNGKDYLPSPEKFCCSGGVGGWARDRLTADAERQEGEGCPPRLRFLLGLRFNVNQATMEELELLPGIGPKTAAKIVEAREKSHGFRSPAELTAIPGLSPEARTALEQWARCE